MTDYNDGKWHGWNGGGCPVHPKSEVRLWDAASGQEAFTAADAAHWSFSGAFRVTKPYRAPREWWAWQDGEGLWHMAEMQVAGAIHVREVTDE